MQPAARNVPYRVSGVSSLVGRVLPIGEWAERAAIPSRKSQRTLDGVALERMFGIHGKSWDPALFADFDAIVRTARAALDAAHVTPCDIDAVLVVTSTPYQVMFDQDAFRLMRALRVPDHVPPILLGSGCAGIARAMAVAAQLSARTVLVVCYCVASLATGDGKGGVSPRYVANEHHSCRSTLWASPVLFSDAACALVLSRSESAEGVAVYSRDSLSFGDDAGFEDPLMHFEGGASEHPAGSEEGDQLACYGMNSAEVRRYYSRGMLLNHQALTALSPGYVSRVRRIYTHQASPALVEQFKNMMPIDPEKLPSNVREFGNLVGPCTIKMLHDDVCRGEVAAEDLICVSVVGGGPERGAMLVRLDLCDAGEPQAPSV